MKYIILPIEFATPLYDEFTYIRHCILRIPLGLSFNNEEVSSEWRDVYFVAWSPQYGVLGGLILQALSKTEFKMRQVAVLHEFQHKGIGKKMVLFSEKWVVQNGGNMISLHARKPATAFYRALNYELHPTQFMEVGIPHYKMHKYLLSPKE